MERSVADDEGYRGMSDVSVAVADAPSTSGAHWANRDNDHLYRRSGTPFRRPNALNSFPGGADQSAGDDEDPASWWGTPDSGPEPGDHGQRDPRPAREANVPQQSWPDVQDQPWPDAPDRGWSDARERAWADAEQDRAWPVGATEPAWTDEPQRQFAPAPEFGPAPPANGGRASFGVTAGPIGGYRPGYGPPAPGGNPDSRTDYGFSAAGGPGYGAAPDARPVSPAGRPVSPATRPVSPAPRSKPLVPPVTGHTGELFDGPAREILSHRAVKQNTGGHNTLKEPTPPRGTPIAAPDAGPRRSRGVTVAAFALGTLMLLGGAAGAVTYFSDGGTTGIASVLDLSSARSGDRTVTAPLDGRSAATFEMVAASSQVSVKTEDLGDDLYRITTGDDSGVLPAPAVSADRVQLQLTAQGDGTSGDVTVVLSAKVNWSLKFSGGSDEQVINLAGGRIADVNLAGGARRVELTLPPPTGTVPVLVTGALDELSVNSPGDAPIRVKVEAGAKTVAAGTRTLRDVEPGSTLTPKGWQVRNRYDLDAKSWVTLLSVDAKG